MYPRLLLPQQKRFLSLAEASTEDVDESSNLSATSTETNTSDDNWDDSSNDSWSDEGDDNWSDSNSNNKGWGYDESEVDLNSQRIKDWGATEVGSTKKWGKTKNPNRQTAHNLLTKMSSMVNYLYFLIHFRPLQKES